jgi:hypothetical protein
VENAKGLENEGVTIRSLCSLNLKPDLPVHKASLEAEDLNTQPLTVLGQTNKNNKNGVKLQVQDI